MTLALVLTANARGAWLIESPTENEVFFHTSQIAGDGDASAEDGFIFRFKQGNITYQSVPGTSEPIEGGYSWNATLNPPTTNWPLQFSSLELVVNGNVQDTVVIEVRDQP